MKNTLILLLTVFNLCPTFSQNKLTTKSASWSNSKKCVSRNVENFIQMLEMSSTEFESEMKKVGARVTLGQNFCITASEQFGMGASINDPALIFNKCDDYLTAKWYGDSKSSSSAFMSFMTEIKDYYIETKDGKRIYGLKYLNRDYKFTFERVLKGNSMFEIMALVRINN